MKAIAVVPGTRTVGLVDRPEPAISAPHEVKLHVIRVGICGTDREEVAGGRAKAPLAHEDLVPGHDMFGRVEDVGWTATRQSTSLTTSRSACASPPELEPVGVLAEPFSVAEKAIAGWIEGVAVTSNFPVFLDLRRAQRGNCRGGADVTSKAVSAAGRCAWERYAGVQEPNRP